MSVEYLLGNKDDYVEIPSPWGRIGNVWEPNYRVPLPSEIGNHHGEIRDGVLERPYTPRPEIHSPDFYDSIGKPEWSSEDEPTEKRGIEIIDYSI